MRTIGKKNINLVKQKTKEVISEKGHCLVSEDVFEELPEELWNIWEGAHQEIERIIHEEIIDEIHN